MSAVDDDMQAAVSDTWLPLFLIFVLIIEQTLGHSSQTQIADPTLQIRERDKELTHIAQSIADLAELFKDLSTLVIDQGTLLDSVEYNIEQTSVQMSEAVKELDTATRYACFTVHLRAAQLISGCGDTDIRKIQADALAFSSSYLLSSVSS